MGGGDRQIVLRVSAAVLTVIAAIWLALWYFIPAPPSSITIAVGFKDGSFDNIAKRYRDRLARHHIDVNVIYNNQGSINALKLIEDRSSGVDAVFTFGGVTNWERLPNVVSMGRIDFNPVWIFYTGQENFERLTQIRGRRIGANLDFPPILKVLERNGVTANNSTLLHLFGPPAVAALKKGEVDLVVSLADLNSPVTQAFLHDPTIHLMNLTQAEGLARVFPFLNRLVLPQGVIDFQTNIPANDVSLIAITSSLIVRNDLHPQLIFLLAQTLHEEHGGAGIFRREGEFPSQTDPDFPVAEEALDYYRNGPSFLQRYLPFWMINYAKRVAAILVTAIAIIIPIFSYAPRLYAWFLQNYMEKLYGRLSVIEARLRPDLTVAEIEVLQSDLENIGRAARILPMRHSSLFFVHIRLTRSELASRLAAALRGQDA